MNNDIAQVIADIEKVACLINIQGKHNVFVRNSGHIQQVDVELHLGGWKLNNDPSLSDSIYYDLNSELCEYEDSIKSLRRIRDTLRKIYKNGKINLDNYDYEIKEVKHYKFRSNW